jgi:hypothetical protein
MAAQRCAKPSRGGLDAPETSRRATAAADVWRAGRARNLSRDPAVQRLGGHDGDEGQELKEGE